MKALIILNDPPYGTESNYNGLRLDKPLIGESVQATVFLMADAVLCANRGQKVSRFSTTWN